MVHTGNGKGKTTCALGLMMRAAGRGLHCCMIQFMKSRNDRYGEHVSAEKLGIEVHTMGDGFTWDTKNPEQDIKTARATWDLCVEKLRSGDTTCSYSTNWFTCSATRCCRWRKSSLSFARYGPRNPLCTSS